MSSAFLPVRRSFDEIPRRAKRPCRSSSRFIGIAAVIFALVQPLVLGAAAFPSALSTDRKGAFFRNTLPRVSLRNSQRCSRSWPSLSLRHFFSGETCTGVS